MTKTTTTASHEEQIYGYAEYERIKRGLDHIPAAYTRERDFGRISEEWSHVLNLDGDYAELVGALRIGEPDALINSLEYSGFRQVGNSKTLGNGQRINTKWVYRPALRDAREFIERCESHATVEM